MPRPLAWRHLARLHELTTTASACRIWLERKLVVAPPVVDCAAADRALAEEVLALAAERRWKLPDPVPYEWGRVGDESDPLPRLVRVIERDAFELDGFARDTDDEEVRSLLLQARNERHALLRALERVEPLATLPGAK
ncbi:MAG: hypothetical protein KF878_17635 [Planctomycetes bacterium]|nr:hypothetical protein [Planctomycetota bacterium]MCW8140624.1 hypothetical protein [Planctomycetota bacterium]